LFGTLALMAKCDSAPNLDLQVQAIDKRVEIRNALTFDRRSRVIMTRHGDASHPAYIKLFAEVVADLHDHRDASGIAGLALVASSWKDADGVCLGGVE
jgi:hypothetical protein